MAHTDACKIQAVELMDRRRGSGLSIRAACREVSKESDGIPAGTIRRWYYEERFKNEPLEGFEQGEPKQPKPKQMSQKAVWRNVAMKMESSHHCPTRSGRGGGEKHLEIQQTIFDYGALPVEDREFVKEAGDEIESWITTTSYRIGKKLLEVKERLPHGQFGKWLEFRFGWSERTGQNYMNIARYFKSARDADLFTNGVQNLLSSPSTPETARAEAIEKAGSGETITHKDAKELIEAHKRIEELEGNIRDLQNLIPTDDVKTKIAHLETELEAAKNQKPETIEVPPKDKDAREARNKRIFDLWMSCYTQEEIAERENLDKANVSRICCEMAELPERNKPAADHLTAFDPPIYNVWHFS